MNSDLKIFCVTDKPIPLLEKTNLVMAGVGTNEFSKNYIKSSDGNNIFHKEKYYSELTFHYWYWKNLLAEEVSEWVGFCQKRRFWIKYDSKNKLINFKNIDEHILKNPCNDWANYNSIICESTNVSGAKKIKLIKRGWRNIIRDPSILFNKKKETIKVHFDLHHGFGNLDKAIQVMDLKDRDDFKNFVNNNCYYNPHIMFIAKKDIINNWFQDLFNWLEECEVIFGFKNLHGYDTGRLYAYLAERYLSFWFRKYTKFKEHPWTFVEQ